MAASDVLMASSAERTPSFKRAKSKIVLGEEEFGVGHHIDKLGFGWYQAEAFLFCAGALWCESINLSSIAGIKEPIYKEFHITSDLGQSLLVTLLYSGFTIGTAAAGSVGDTKGRRVPIMVGFMGMALSQVLLFYVPNLAGLYILVFVLGCCAGFPIPAAVTMMGEVVPSHFRGMAVGALALGLSMGELTSAIGLRLFVPNLVDGAWRFQLLWAAIPPVFLLLMGLFCSATAFDSPHFLASHNRQKELRGALNLMAEMNGRPDFVLEHDLPGDEGESDVSFAEARDVLFSGKMGMYTFALCVMFFTFNWGYYGTVDFWPLGWEGMHLQGIDKATEMIFTALIGFIGVPVAMFTMHSVPRRPGICVAALFCFIASVCLHGLLVDSIVKGWVGVVLFKIFWMTFQMTSCLLPSEIYPTRISVWGFSIVCFFGRLGCIMAPIAISFSSSVFLNVLAVLLLATASMVWALPETSDVDLEALDNPMLVDKLGVSGSVYGSCVPSFSASPA